jgi:cell division protein FtsZ
MIDLQRHQSPSASAEVRIKIVGLGGAGCNALDRLVLDGVPGAELIGMNTDAQALAGCVAPEKLQLGRSTTRGLGAGGDPELGYEAAEESLDAIRAIFDGAQMVFLCVGLGGGTGSGAARLVGSVAREQGALVIGFATMPFSFEGKRRTAQAEEALAALQSVSDVVICFDNDKLGDAVSPRAGIQDAFVAADQTISQSVRAIAALAAQRGIIHIGFDELASALRAGGNGASRCIFGTGEAEGDNRAHESLAKALKSPLMDKGRMLEDARSVLVNVSGGPGMTLSEVQILMEEFNRHVSDQTQILFGTSVDARLGQKMTVTIISAIGTAAPVPVEAPRAIPRMTMVAGPNAEPDKATATKLAESLVAPSLVASEPAIADDEEVPPLPEPAVPGEADNGASRAAARKAAREAKQEQMQFEPVTRGRFEKSEPTIVDGQDLDVPTFLRRNLKVK